MNKEAEAQLKKILAKEVHELTDYDKAFLRARRAYVGRRSREKFASILNDTPVKTETTEIEQQLEEALQEPEAPFIQTVDTDDEVIQQIN